MASHQSSHSGMKRKMCQFCGKSFSRSHFFNYGHNKGICTSLNQNKNKTAILPSQFTPLKQLEPEFPPHSHDEIPATQENSEDERDDLVGNCSEGNV